jgi:Leucine-rich repeat (LRR) protein
LTFLSEPGKFRKIKRKETMKKLLCAILSLIVATHAQAPACTFETIDGIYTCKLANGNIDSTFLEADFTTVHTDNSKTDSLVKRVITTTPASHYMVRFLFKRFTTLESFHLPTGNLADIVTTPSGETFDTCVSLKEIQISQNIITTLKDSAFVRCSNVERYEVTQSNITSVGVNAFAAGSKTINLSNNKINLDGTFFTTQTSLASLVLLNLSANAIQNVPTSFKLPSTELKILDLTSNSINSVNLNKILTGATKIENLNLSRNSLSDMADNSFTNLQSLQVLVLNENGITQLTARHFEANTHLKELFLRMNQLKSINGTLSTNVDLEVLDVSANSLTNIDLATIVNLKKLKSLNVSSNQLDMLSMEVMNNFEKLEILLVNGNRLTNVPTLTANKNLKEFHAHSNQIENIYVSTFDANVNLEALDLSGNSIKRIESKSFDKLTKLKLLKLSGCRETNYASNSTVIGRATLDDIYSKCGAGSIIISNLLIIFVIFMKLI